jgi:predicted transcriptional regulator
MSAEANAAADLHSWHIAAIKRVFAKHAGRVVPHEDVVAWVKSWGSSDELSMPKPNRRPGESRDPLIRVRDC